ncbi:glycosyltransferase [Deefgea sp. CFH1-16]|uniref:glycosyltransferase n=1 Tax=Deefgea sp. CFH1-16 TaxID=2675457 RepID=UPI0015F462B6|nr:glycosyltransferase [Deefgea sp. CFH1-16]
MPPTTVAARLRVLNLAQNKGIEGALNAGLQWATSRDYTWIARLDCGDENVSTRIALQMAFLAAHPEVVLLGGAASFVDQNGVEQFVLRHPTEHAEILQFMKKKLGVYSPKRDLQIISGRYARDVSFGLSGGGRLRAVLGVGAAAPSG